MRTPFVAGNWKMNKTADAAVAFVTERHAAGVERAALLEEYIAWNRQRARANHISPAAIERYEAANPLFMSVDGILRYLRKREAR